MSAIILNGIWSARGDLIISGWRRNGVSCAGRGLKFSPPESAVTLRVKYEGMSQVKDQRVRLAVLDQGPGIPEEYRARVFDPFETVQLKEGVPQIGLGLAFCKMAVEAHGGHIFVGANEPTGTVFAVEI